MQKLKLQNVYNKETKKFIVGEFQLKEYDKIISGKVNISSKVKDKWVNKDIPFIAFKSQLDESDIAAIKSGEFMADFGIAVNEFQNDKGKTIKYHQLIINKAEVEGVDQHNQAKANAYVDEDSDLIPF